MGSVNRIAQLETPICLVGDKFDGWQRLYHPSTCRGKTQERRLITAMKIAIMMTSASAASSDAMWKDSTKAWRA